MGAISLAEQQRRLQAFIGNIIRETATVVAANAIEIIAVNRSQMYHGLNGAGGQIGHYADIEYAHDKYDQNPAAGFGNVDLYLTGSFYSKLELRVQGDSFLLTSTDSKTDALIRKYGSKIFKLGAEAKNEVRKTILQPSLVHVLAEQIGGQIV